jgi:protein phosphatase 1 regulatory subunit 37
MSSSNEIDTLNVAIDRHDVSLPLKMATRRVHFPSDESQLRMISIAPEPFANQPLLSLGVILQRYRATCQRLQIRPLNCLLDQLTSIDDNRRTFDDRLACLKIVYEKLDVKQMDAIEEILSRCRFHRLDLDSSIYDDSTLIQFFDIIEYYESCTHLNLSNHRSINAQGYQALTRYLRRTRVLERLDMNSVRFDDTMMFSFGRALRMASTLSELHVESCQLNGKILQKFISHLRTCSTIRELYLCDNRMSTIFIRCVI